MKNNLFRGIIVLLAVLLITAAGMTIYNNSTEMRAVETAIMATEEVFKTRVEYSKDSDRIIVEKHLKDEEELYNLTKYGLPNLSTIGEHNVVKLLSFRAYYGETKEDFQFYDIKFKDINKLDWDEINNFDDFLFYLNVKMD